MLIGTEFLGQAFTAVMLFLGVAYTAYQSRQSNQNQVASELSETLLERMAALEGKVEALERQVKVLNRVLTTFAGFTNRIGFWNAQGRTEPIPHPPKEIQEYIDMAYWEEQRKEGVEG